MLASLSRKRSRVRIPLAVQRPGALGRRVAETACYAERRADRTFGSSKRNVGGAYGSTLNPEPIGEERIIADRGSSWESMSWQTNEWFRVRLWLKGCTLLEVESSPSYNLFPGRRLNDLVLWD